MSEIRNPKFFPCPGFHRPIFETLKRRDYVFETTRTDANLTNDENDDPLSPFPLIMEESSPERADPLEIPCSFVGYWWRAVRHSFTKGWIAVGAISTIGSIIAPFLRSFDPWAANHAAFWNVVDKYGLAWACIAVFWLVVAIRILYAPYLTYKEQVAGRNQLREQHSSLLSQIHKADPEIHCSILRALHGAGEVNGVSDVPIVLLTVDVRNHGTPSMVEGWPLTVKSPRFNGLVHPTLISRKMNVGASFMPETDGVFDPAGQIFHKTVTPIKQGEFIRGELFYALPGIPKNWLDNSKAELELECCDVKGHKSICSITLSSSESYRHVHIPGAQVIWNPKPPPLKDSE